ncbi:MAG: sigma-E factor negative regulatory protein RseB [Flavobacteriales bacterium]|jgi:sigma-E factor negative regulatory protein RseB
MRRLFFLLSIALLSPCWAQSEGAPPAGSALLNRMVSALRIHNYSGDFSFEYDGRLESFSIEHFADDSREFERLFRLTGNRQEFVRQGSAPRCGTIGGHLLAGSHLNLGSGDNLGLDQQYDITLVGQDRIAGKVVLVVNLVPKDSHRYGMSFFIDAENYLPLSYVVFDAQKKQAIERLQFVSIKTNLEKESFEPAQSGSAIALDSQLCIGSVFSPNGHSPWKPAWLPPGFVLSHFAESKQDGYMETYTDGLFSFSIFVKETDVVVSDNGRIEQGATSRGALLTLISQVPLQKSTRVSEGVSVSVVGEIPFGTAQKLTRSISRVPSPTISP